MLQEKGCEATEQLVSDIMNEIILRMGVRSSEEESAQLNQDINTLSNVREELREYKFRKWCEREYQLETQIETKSQIVQDIGFSLNQQRKTKEDGFESIRIKFAQKVRQDVINKETQQLKKNKQYLLSIRNRLQEIKTNIQKSKEDIYASQYTPKSFNKSLQQLNTVAQKMSRQFKESTASVQQQLVDTKAHIKQTSGKILSQKARLNAQRQLSLRIKQSKSIQRDIDRNVLTIQNSSKKLGQSDQSPLHVQKLVPAYSFKDQAIIYLIVVLFILLVHYVFK